MPKDDPEDGGCVMTRQEWDRRSSLWARLAESLADRCANAVFMGDMRTAVVYSKRRGAACERRDHARFMSDSDFSPASDSSEAADAEQVRCGVCGMFFVRFRGGYVQPRTTVNGRDACPDCFTKAGAS